MKDRRLAFKSLGIISIVLFFLASCSSSPYSGPAYLDGYISGKTDVSAAALKVTNASNGYVHAEKAPATSDYGAFMLTVNELPYEFRVVSSGGTEEGTSVDYKLMAHFVGFNPAKDRIYVNLATTLVCVYLNRNTDNTLAEATTAVKTFLDIPDEVDIGEGLHNNNKYFSPSKFMAQAAANGGVDAFMEILVDEMSQGPAAKHPFVASSMLAGDGGAIAACAGTSMAEAARNGAIAWGAGFALNKGMGALFPGTGAPTKADLNELKGMLTQIQTQLTQLSYEIASAKTEINAEIVKSEYNIGTMQLADYVSLVENTFIDLKKEIQKDPATLTSAERTQRINTINAKLKTIGDKIEPFLGSLHKKLHGDGTLDAQGLYKIYADKIKAQKRFLSKANYQDKVKTLFLYFNQLETTALYLAVEYYHANDLSQTIVDTHTEQLGTDSKAELDWYNSVKHMTGQLLLDTRQKLMIYEGDYIPDIKTKAPIYATRLNAGSHIDTMNYQQWAGFNDWRKTTTAEVTGFCGGQRDCRAYLESQGWYAPVPRGMYFGTSEVGMKSEIINWIFGKRPTEVRKTFSYKVYDTSGAQRYFDIEEKQIWSYDSDRFISNETVPPNWHWVLVRTTAPEEYVW
ncbi:MAG: hypothetical protein A4E69_02773 [Syntrophus sp. PtaB.Bin138]|nr:MAG: hypothetical protein A4E69_02773 [Syntrophus sp. PtaB.Bin138]